MIHLVMKRNIVTILWFLMGWGVGNVLFGPTEMLALVPGIVLAGLVYWDPLHVLWSPSHRDARRVRPINEVADELDRRGAQRSAAEADRSTS
jgi:hypothetical protein